MRGLEATPLARAYGWRAGVAAGVMPALLLLACSPQSGLPGPSKDADMPARVAALLAAGVAKKDVSQVPFSGQTGADVQAHLAPVLAGMGGLRPQVGVGAVHEQGDKATAALHYTWTFPGVPRPWSYDTAAALVKMGSAWQVSWSPAIVAAGLNGTNRLSEQREPAARGGILGADGESIVQPRPVVRIGIDKTRLPRAKLAGSATRVAKLVGITAKSYVLQVLAAGPRDFVEAIVFRADARQRPSNRAVYAIDGAVVLPGEAMLAPTRDFARAILGTVGPASKASVDASQGQVVAGDQVGRSGLQRRYDQQLRGTPGVTVRLVVVKPTSASASASPGPSASPTTAPAPRSSTLFTAKPVAGRDLALSLNVAMQNLAERVLNRTKPAAALVAIRPSTGEVLAAADGPGSGDVSVATVGRFPPGSTFKVASSLALLRSGLHPDSPVTCPPAVTVNGKQFKNYSDYPPSHLGQIDLQTALAQSCNTAFIGQRSRLSGTALADAAASLGVGIDYDVGFASYFGSVPPDATATGRAAAMIGQGQVLASPLSMGAVVASVSAGHTVIPHLVTATRPLSRAKPLTLAEAGTLRDMMRAVVSQGSGRVLRGMAGPPVLAKTGTAEYGAKPPFKTHAWMIAAQGDLAVAVFVAIGSTGSHTAGPLLRQFLSQAQ